jgi:hypothetical protein
MLLSPFAILALNSAPFLQQSHSSQVTVQLTVAREPRPKQPDG